MSLDREPQTAASLGGRHTARRRVGAGSCPFRRRATKSARSSSDCSLKPKRTWRWRWLGQHRNRARAYGRERRHICRAPGVTAHFANAGMRMTSNATPLNRSKSIALLIRESGRSRPRSRRVRARGKPECHVASVPASFHPGCQLGVGVVSGPLQFGLFDQSSHILIRCSTRRSTTRRATDLKRSECGMLPK